jgi:RNA polymerase sigma-70 factor (ECF subfamily)
MPVSQRTTTTSQLLRDLLDDSADDAWREFDQRYRGIIIGLGRRLGLDQEAAEEAAQQALAEFARDYRAGRYDRSKGRLTAWLLGIARHRILDAGRSMARRRPQRGESALGALPDEDEMSQMWEAQRERAVLQQALRELRENTRTDPKTMHAFELFVLHETPAQMVAETCDISTAEVYRIKNRLTKRLREIVARLTRIYSEEA